MPALLIALAPVGWGDVADAEQTTVDRQQQQQNATTLPALDMAGALDGKNPVLDRVTERNNKANEISRRAREIEGSEFAGLTLRDKNVVVKTTTPVDPSTAEALRALGQQESLSVEFDVINDSLANLEQNVQLLTDNLTRLRDEGLSITSVGVDESRNAVRVGISDTAQVSAVRDRLLTLESFASTDLLIETELPFGAASSQTNSPGLFKAALRIEVRKPIPQTGGAACTSGFAVEDSSGRHFQLTAGHCGVPGAGADVMHGGIRVGQVTQSQYSGNMDAATFSLDLGQSSPWLFRQNDYLTPITGFSSAVSDTGVCAKGSVSGYKCSFVTTNNRTVVIAGGPTLTEQHCANITNITEGDSGGPIYNSTGGIGLMSASNGFRGLLHPCTKGR